MPYCGKCGQWLEEGQTCTCKAGAATDNYAGGTPAHMYASDYRYAGTSASASGMSNAYSGDTAGTGANSNPGVSNDTGGYGSAGATGSFTGGYDSAGAAGDYAGGYGNAGAAGNYAGGYGSAGTAGSSAGGYDPAGAAGNYAGGYGSAGASGSSAGGYDPAGAAGNYAGGYGSAGTAGSSAGGYDPAGAAAGNYAGGYDPAGAAGNYAGGYDPAGSAGNYAGGYGPAGAAGSSAGGYGPAGAAGSNPYDGHSTNPEPPKPDIKAPNPSEVINDIAPFFAGFLSMISSLWIRFKNRVGLGEPETNDVDYYERNLEIVPQCIDPDSGEMPIKQYDMAVLRTRLILSRAEGRLQVTNKRVIFRATGRSLMGRTTLQHEFAIDEIAGIKLRKDHRFSFLNLLGVSIVIGLGIYAGIGILHRFYMWGIPTWLIGLLTLMITGIAFVPFFLLYKKFPLKLLLVSLGYGMLVGQQQYLLYYASDFVKKIWGLPVILVGLILLFISWIICWVPNLIVNVETKGTQPAVEIRRKEAGILNMFRKPEYTGFAEVLPWKDTELAIIELWAMVSDIQKYGDEAIKQWKSNSGE